MKIVKLTSSPWYIAPYEWWEGGEKLQWGYQTLVENISYEIDDFEDIDESFVFLIRNYSNGQKLKISVLREKIEITGSNND
jgi:hypothetical protein